MEADAFVVVDVLRASTTIAALFDAGARRLTATARIAHARALARAPGALLFGEVGGLPPKGFDHGNSPVEAAAAPVRGRDVVLFTTNGTRALTMLGDRPAYVAALVNAAAVAETVARTHRSVAVVCAGTAGGRRFTLEDLAGAGVIVERLRALAPRAQLGDGAVLAAGAVARWPGGPAGMVREAAHARVTAELGFAADIDFACRIDSSAAVPMVVHRDRHWTELADRRTN